MNKTELVKKVAAECELSQKDAAAAVESVAPAAILPPARKSRFLQATLRSSRLARLSRTRLTANSSNNAFSRRPEMAACFLA